MENLQSAILEECQLIPVSSSATTSSGANENLGCFQTVIQGFADGEGTGALGYGFVGAVVGRGEGGGKGGGATSFEEAGLLGAPPGFGGTRRGAYLGKAFTSGAPVGAVAGDGRSGTFSAAGATGGAFCLGTITVIPRPITSPASAA